MIGAAISPAAPLAAVAIGILWRGRRWAFGLGLPAAKRRLEASPFDVEDTQPSRAPILPRAGVVVAPRRPLPRGVLRVAQALLLLGLGFVLGRWGAP